MIGDLDDGCLDRLAVQPFQLRRVADDQRRASAINARIRSTRPPRPAILRPTGDGRAEVELLDPEEGVSPGQACVFYATEGTRVLGGGWIAYRRAA